MILVFFGKAGGGAGSGFSCCSTSIAGCCFGVSWMTTFLVVVVVDVILCSVLVELPL